ncbi:MAG: imidazoleglycerol-phosphate dehydratase HisB [Armatimonadetes bacterium]|nr:imidazoleglycerol-phosphate dehydratase HisB [Armatimonadota bacterium]NIM24946.1 imidazoleglycerol-phosphate dehydratase HisB [Armatimonadota bacterium]NIM68832.1 imidazoleglycerol-phosphate dehydratase HisB [Armatimonadota bacterium]NIM77079.1 imidazoleglycerol-phosphate dehydratase HisB [Armatimonadota bacterium]NIN07037.1 imidazoleglycerol-phosphate dehydratase HisB [Armatimonadota bacterium]
MRKANVQRKTKETQIKVKLSLDGSGTAKVSTGIGFLDHMLTLLATHGLMDLTLEAKGDLKVDKHHTVEDVGLSLGKALKEALGDKRGIARYGSAIVPMDEALAMAALDFSGRSYLVLDLTLRAKKIGDFEVELLEEFLRGLVSSADLTLHLLTVTGRNSHHIVEAAFKALGRALSDAMRVDPRRKKKIPSSKGVL